MYFQNLRRQSTLAFGAKLDEFDIRMENDPKPMGKAWPVTLSLLLGGGVGIFFLKSFFDFPVETAIAKIGMLIFVGGMIFGLVAFQKSISTLANPNARRKTGWMIPLLTASIALSTWVLS